MTLSILAANPEPWTAHARCRDGYNPDDWFPHSLADSREAILCCRACPVIADCAAYALRTDQVYGIWGGVTELERRALKRGQPVQRRQWSSPVAVSARSRQRQRLRQLRSLSGGAGHGGGR